MPTIHHMIQTATGNFVASTIAALLGATIEELQALGSGQSDGTGPQARLARFIKHAKTGGSPRLAAAPAPHLRRSYTDAQIAKVLSHVRENPGKRSEEIQAALRLGRKVVGKILERLRVNGKVRTKGEKRTTTYSAVAESAAPRRAPGNARGASRQGITRHGTASRRATRQEGPEKKWTWPSCSTSGCQNKMFGASGKARLCYTHFVAAGGSRDKKAVASA